MDASVDQKQCIAHTHTSAQTARRFSQPTFDSSALPPHILELFSTCHGLTQLQEQVSWFIEVGLI
jgi:hypothetical protein